MLSAIPTKHAIAVRGKRNSNITTASVGFSALPNRAFIAALNVMLYCPTVSEMIKIIAKSTTPIIG
jgi:hypothetical protein